MHKDEFDDFEFQVESRLTSHGVYVQTFEEREDENTYAVTYESIAAEQGSVPHSEIGRVINVLRDLHADDWSGADVEATVHDLEGEVRGYWYVDAEWFDGLHNGDLSQTDFSEKVLETLSV
ncbi:hypothetical protein [Haloarcula sp. JP-L23]|uniref:hypothetical protein n=1 Tax=Haloarcula sp. JP-L23 TaxID=2716717 RepID=UPI00140F1D90|nr:hypothetical protein G9465_05965 [Haloarcula sp. JP-L23]